ncbi:MAG: hypothetical protein ACO1RA_02000 [Planctomycetaceae bacterium]
MTSTSRQIGFGITYVVAVGLIILGALLVVGLAPKGIVQTLADSALLQYRASIGAVAIAGGMFLFTPGLLPIGFAISNSLVAGLLTAHLVAEDSPLFPGLLLALLWIGAGLRSGWLQGAFRVSSAETAQPGEPAH